MVKAARTVPLLALLVGGAAVPLPTHGAAQVQMPAPVRRVPNGAFLAGEYLEFSIRFKFIHVGTAVLEIPSAPTVFGRPCLQLRESVRTAAFFDAFYKVRDRVESCLDAEALVPLKFERHLSEGSYRMEEETFFDQQRHLAVNLDTEAVVPAHVQDTLSAFYYVRTLKLEPGMTIQMPSFEGTVVHPLQVIVHRRETLKVPAGEFQTVVIEPRLGPRGGLFHSSGPIFLWLTDDARHMPVQMRTSISLGNVTAELATYRTGEP